MKYSKKAIKAQNLIIAEANDILFERLSNDSQLLTSTSSVREYLKSEIGQEEREVFAVLFLDNKYRMIEFQVMFQGTIDKAEVYPREIVREALKLNAAAIIISHNHPSGDYEPSEADKRVTTEIHKACSILDIRLLDHMIVAGNCVTSFAERGLLVKDWLV